MDILAGPEKEGIKVFAYEEETPRQKVARTAVGNSKKITEYQI